AAFAIAKAGSAVIAYDLSPKMLALVEQEADQRGLMNIATQLGAAEHLPFTTASCDLVATRFSAHHWSHVPAALAEVRRVLKPTGIVLVIDTVAAENPLFDTVLQTVEILGDASHIRDYRVSEWQAMLQAAGFDMVETDSWSLPVEFANWAAIKRTSERRIEAIQGVFEQVSDEVRQHFKLQADCSFDLEVAWLQAKPAF
ncbi:MAG: SAM-dependent methyltransferase, partial [Methylovulum sp.]